MVLEEFSAVLSRGDLISPAPPRASRSYTLRVLFEGYEALKQELTAECDEDNKNSTKAIKSYSP